MGVSGVVLPASCLWFILGVSRGSAFFFLCRLVLLLLAGLRAGVLGLSRLGVLVAAVSLWRGCWRVRLCRLARWPGRRGRPAAGGCRWWLGGVPAAARPPLVGVVPGSRRSVGVVVRPRCPALRRGPVCRWPSRHRSASVCSVLVFSLGVLMSTSFASPSTAVRSAFRAGSFAGVVVRPSRRSPSGVVLAVCFRSPARAAAFAARWAGRLGVSVAVRPGPRAGLVAVSLPVAGCVPFAARSGFPFPAFRVAGLRSVGSVASSVSVALL